jgi:hypothetical protein
MAYFPCTPWLYLLSVYSVLLLLPSEPPLEWLHAGAKAIPTRRTNSDCPVAFRFLRIFSVAPCYALLACCLVPLRRRSARFRLNYVIVILCESGASQIFNYSVTICRQHRKGRF